LQLELVALDIVESLFCCVFAAVAFVLEGSLLVKKLACLLLISIFIFSLKYFALKIRHFCIEIDP